MLKQINIKSGSVLKNKFIGNQYDINYNYFFDKEELLITQYGDYLLKVHYRKGRMFDVVILKNDFKNNPVIKQEVGDYESLVFALQNYIDLLDSFNQNNGDSKIKFPFKLKNN